MILFKAYLQERSIVNYLQRAAPILQELIVCFLSRGSVRGVKMVLHWRIFSQRPWLPSAFCLGSFLVSRLKDSAGNLLVAHSQSPSVCWRRQSCKAPYNRISLYTMKLCKGKSFKICSFLVQWVEQSVTPPLNLLIPQFDL